jgi:hypothetical protein
MEISRKPVIATQPELTPEAANPPPEVEKIDPAAGRWSVASDELPVEKEEDTTDMRERRKRDREEQLTGGH